MLSVIRIKPAASRFKITSAAQKCKTPRHFIHRSGTAEHLGQLPWSRYVVGLWRPRRGVEVQLYPFFHLVARWGGGWLTPRLARFTPGKETRSPLHKRLCGPQSRSGLVRKTSPLLTLLFVLSLYFVSTLLSWLCRLSLLYYTDNTNIHAPGGIRTRNPSKRSATSPRLRPLGHRDRLIWSPDRLAHSKSIYRLNYRDPHPRILLSENESCTIFRNVENKPSNGPPCRP